ncbi:ESX secretion-associated protein EspG [Prauserella cavernicola]|uniref:ESX secretion-associated protein EspG n=1 Tax=Prauserella cavernicola TaxID=2800127 RepID=A0A934V494_9PSEU|nr:ESX secretion-associated protein EspG [Prauserella cavernicola]MBK1783343.1 ESX secretion-associated protein EspG [Prauserella cavernicola]
MSERFEFVLGSVEASVVGQALGVDVRRFPLRIRNTTTDPVRLVKLAKIVTGELAKRRLVVGNTLHSHLHTTFGLLGDHRVSVAITGIDGLGADIAVLAVTDGSRALGITQRDDELFFSVFSDDELVDVLAGVLPPAQPAPGGPATVRSSVTEHRSALAARRAAEREHDEEETDAFGNISIVGMAEPPPERNRRGTESDERKLRRVLEGERHGGGQISVTGRGDRGTPQSLSWLDAEQGRYLIHTTDGDGEFVARYEPAGYNDVVRAIRDAVSRAY